MDTAQDITKYPELKVKYKSTCLTDPGEYDGVIKGLAFYTEYSLTAFLVEYIDRSGNKQEIWRDGAELWADNENLEFTKDRSTVVSQITFQFLNRYFFSSSRNDNRIISGLPYIPIKLKPADISKFKGMITALVMSWDDVNNIKVRYRISIETQFGQDCKSVAFSKWLSRDDIDYLAVKPS